jgi:5'-3' exonuclease
MGFSPFLAYLPGGTTYGEGLHSLGLEDVPVNIDAAGLLWQCAFRCQEDYLNGNIVPAAKLFQDAAANVYFNLRWDALFVFDGADPAEKRHEHARRRGHQDQEQHDNDDDNNNDSPESRTIRNTGEYIALCAKICRELQIPFLVSPLEADAQVVFTRQSEDLVVVTGDADIFAYGQKKVVLIKSWSSNCEIFRTYDLDGDYYDSPGNLHVINRAYIRFGVVAFQVWAAVVGCDISVTGSGISGVGPATIEAAFEELLLDENVVQLQSSQFSMLLHEKARKFESLATTDEIESELLRVVKWFSLDAQCYDSEGNIISKKLGHIIHGTAINQRRHMQGARDPKSYRGSEALADESCCKLEAYNTSDAFHHSTTTGMDERASLPTGRDSLGTCTVSELQKMVLARGGGIKDTAGKNMNKAALVLLLKKYFFLEKEVPSQQVYYNRDREKNGTFAKINTDNGADIPTIVSQLIGASESHNGLLLEVQDLLHDKKFMDDFDDVALHSPELHETTIRAFFIHIGYNPKQKTLGSSYQRVLDLDDVMYHAIAEGACVKRSGRGARFFYILTKVEASYSSDQKTRNKTAVGEKPLRKEYLTVIKVLAEDTTMDTHAHTLGLITAVVDSWCLLCKAGGGGMCIHCSQALYIQFFHWTEGRPVAKPGTSNLCRWLQRGSPSKRPTTTKPASDLQCQKLPKSTKEAEYRMAAPNTKRNTTEGMSARYDVFGNNKDKRNAVRPGALMFSKTRPAIQELWAALREANTKQQNREPWEET